MAIDTLMSFVGTYDSLEDAEADCEPVKTLHTDACDRPGRGAVPFAPGRAARRHHGPARDPGRGRRPRGGGNERHDLKELGEQLDVYGEVAAALFERPIGLANDLGLRAEKYDVAPRRQIGNFPQAFSHLTLILAARAISTAGARVEQAAA